MNRFAPLALIAVSLHAATAAEPTLERRWVYLQLNLQVGENVEQAREIMQRAKAVGYNGVVLADFKLNILDRVPDFYFKNAGEFKKAADELELEIIPAVAPIGYSDGILAHDPNLAEGLPTRGTNFIVRNGTAELISALKDPLPGGGFEEHKNHLVPGWSFQDDPGKSSFVDTDVKHSGKGSLRWDNPQSNARVSRIVSVTPWRQYHASVWIKTKDYKSASSVRLFAMGKDGHELSFSNLGVKQNQDWTQHHVVFNSLDNDEVRIYCGTWGGSHGVLWMDDLRLEETALVNLVRRPGCPLIVRDEDGFVFEEGKDFAELVDPQLGQTPYAGSFDVWHDPPKLKLLPTSRIPDGCELFVDSFHTVTIYDGQVTCCLAEPKVFAVLEDQVRRVERLFSPKTYYMSHDEIRVANWCDACRKEGRSAGDLLAENVRRCAAVIHGVNKDAELCVWSDMFDPHHNAQADFYLVNGDLSGSWNGLPQGMTIINWNHEKASKSLSFFADQGHRQVLSGFYDGDPTAIAGWLKTAEGVAGVNGAMYTTWRNDFSHLETFAKAAWGDPQK